MPKITRLEDLRDDVRIAEACLRQVIWQASERRATDLIKEVEAKRRELDKQVRQIEQDLIEGPAKIAIAEKRVSETKQRVQEHLGGDQIDKLRAIVAKLSALQFGRERKNNIK